MARKVLYRAWANGRFSRFVLFGGQPPLHIGAILTMKTACGLAFANTDIEPVKEEEQPIVYEYDQCCPACHAWIVQDHQAQLAEPESC